MDSPRGGSPERVLVSLPYSDTGCSCSLVLRAGRQMVALFLMMVGWGTLEKRQG